MYKILMFISSYFPLYILIIFIKYDSFFPIRNNIQSIIFTLVFFILIMMSICSFILILNTKANTNRRISGIEKTDDSVLSYLMSYIIPLSTLQKDEIAYLIINITLFVIIGILYLRLDLLFLNPVFALLGFIPYKAEKYIVISDIKYTDLINKINKTSGLNVYEITDTIFLAKRKENEV